MSFGLLKSAVGQRYSAYCRKCARATGTCGCLASLVSLARLGCFGILRLLLETISGCGASLRGCSLSWRTERSDRKIGGCCYSLLGVIRHILLGQQILRPGFEGCSC